MTNHQEKQQPTFDKQARLMLLGGMFAAGLAAPAPAETLTVNQAGSGGGIVTSALSGIDCGLDCTESYHRNTDVKFTTSGASGTVDVTSTAGPGGSINPAGTQTVLAGVSLTFAVIPDRGYTASVDSTCNGSGVLNGSTYTTSPIWQDCTIAATFNRISYRATAVVTGPGGSISPSFQTVPFGERTTFTVTPADASYSINRVEGCDGTLSGNIYTTGEMISDCTVSASFQATPPAASSAHAINLTISTVSPSRYRLLGTLVDANNQPACGLALASGRCVFTCGPGSPRCEGGADTLPFGQFDLVDLPTETNGALNLQTFVFGSLPGLQVVQSDGTIQLVNSGGSRASSGAINTSRSEVSPGRYRLTGTLVDGNNQPACGLALASGRCVFTCGPGSPRCEGGADNLPLGQFDLTDLPAEANGALNLQTFVFGSLPGLQVVNSGGGGSGGGGCTYAITPQSKQFSAQGGSGEEVTVSTQNGCSWTAQSNADWIGITSGNSGTGPGTVKYLVSINPGVASRTGTLTIAGQEFAVSQSPPDSGGGGGQ